MAIKKPTKLTLTLNHDTGTTTAAAKDKITSDATLKLGKLDTGSTIEWRDTTTNTWKAVDSNLLILDDKTKTALLNVAELVDGDFTDKTLDCRQVNAAGVASDATSLKFTYDTTAPEILEVIPPAVDSILNSKTSVVRLTSSEKLSGLDAKDFTLSDPKLATIKSVTEVKPSTPDGDWAYDVTISAAKTGAGAVSLQFASNAAATDVAGNAVDLSGMTTDKLANFWIGNDSLTVSLAEDTGSTFVKNANKDGITHNGTIKLGAIKPDATVEFHIKPNATSLPEGSGEWLSIDDLTVEGTSATVDVADLYELAGLSLDDMPVGGWQDTFEFHQVNGDRTSLTTALTFTYDVVAPTITDSIADADTLLNGKTTLVHLHSDEQLQGIDKADFTFTNAKLASIQNVSTGKFDKASEQWVYDVTVLASKGSVSGATTLKLADNASITDLAGNAVDASNFTEGLADLWIGNDSLLVSLAEDTGKTKDNVTYNDQINLASIKSGSVIEFRINAGSNSLPEGSTEWIRIDDLVIGGSAETVGAEHLYELAGLSLTNIPASGWKDTFEFRQVNEETGRASIATPITFTYDSTAPSINKIVADSDTILNGKSTVVHLYSAEQLLGIDKTDFTLTNSLASVSSVSAGTLDKATGLWGYDVTVKAATGTANGITTLQLANNASITDLAGNAFKFNGYGLQVGTGTTNTSFTAKLAYDIGTSTTDNITSNGWVNLSGIKAGSTIQFHLKSGSESTPNGNNWITIPADLLNNKSVLSESSVYVGNLYDHFIGESMPQDGWKDIWEFRQVDTQGHVLDTSAPITFTYDYNAPLLVDDATLEGPLDNGESVTIRFLSTEQVANLSKDTIEVNNSKLASITSIKESQVTIDDVKQWAYDIIVKTAATGSGELKLSLPTNTTAMDVAGNAAHLLASDHGYNYSIWVGANPDKPVASLVHDTGKAGDNITYDDVVKVYGVTPEDSLEVRLKEGSETAIDGSEWFYTDSISFNGNSTLVNLEDLYRNFGVYSQWEMPNSGLTDIWEFRKTDAEGNVSDVSAGTTITYDPNYPQIEVIMADNVIQNSKTAVIRLLSTEQLLKVDKSAVWIDKSGLASVSDVKETQVTDADGIKHWAYDVTVKTAATGNGLVTGGFYWSTYYGGEVATDAAGNHPGFNFSFWAGSNPPDLQAKLNYDSGIPSDNVTSSLGFDLSAIKSLDGLEVRLKAGSEFTSDGTDWFSIPKEMLYSKGWSAWVSGNDLYSLFNGGDYMDGDSMPANGLQDIWEFRQQGSSSTTSLTVTYDYQTPTIDIIEKPDNILNGETGVIQFMSNEQLANLVKSDFTIDHPELASITAVKETKVSDGEWQYDVSVQASATGSDMVGISLDHAADLAGNETAQYFNIQVGNKNTSDFIAPRIDKITMDTDTLPNSEVTVIHLYSSEKLQGLDTNDFTLSDKSLASIKNISGTFHNEIQQWVYDITVSGTTKDTSGITTLKLSDNASVTDMAGNPLEFSGYDIQVGNISFGVRLINDSGVSNTDNITAWGQLKFSGIKTDAIIQFRLKAGSDYTANDTDWINLPIEKLGDDKTIYIEMLNELLDYQDLIPDGSAWSTNKGIWEFRQVDNQSQVLDTTSPLTITDDTAFAFLRSDTPTEPLHNGQTETIHFFCNEQVVHLDKEDIQVSNSTLASITSVEESHATIDGKQQWVYDIAIKTADGGSGALTLSLSSNTDATDIAGNGAVLGDVFTGYNTWVGEKTVEPSTLPTASLVTDSGNNVYDHVTNDNRLHVSNITDSDTLQFRWKEGTSPVIYNSLNPDEWINVKSMSVFNNVATVYSLLGEEGDAYWNSALQSGALPNLTEAVEFRKVDASGNISATSETFTFTYDLVAPKITQLETATIPNGEKGRLEFISTEKLVGLTSASISTDKEYALDAHSIILNLPETQISANEWHYSADVDTGNNTGDNSGSFTASISSYDLAGNEVHHTFELWIV